MRPRNLLAVNLSQIYQDMSTIPLVGLLQEVDSKKLDHLAWCLRGACQYTSLGNLRVLHWILNWEEASICKGGGNFVALLKMVVLLQGGWQESHPLLR